MEFVVCDDEQFFRDKIKEIIDKIYMKNDEYYHVSVFDSFNKKFENMISDGNKKIYILDIEIQKSLSGIDIARKIREKDWDSTIIFITTHAELGYEALKAQIMLLDFISKFDNFESHLEKTIKKAINKINQNNVLKFNFDGLSYIIHLEDILYIVKETVDRKCIIKTLYNEVEVNKSLSYFIENLDDRFVLSHRSCIVNKDRITKVDWKNNIIYFNDDVNIDLISRDKKKELKDALS